MSFLSRTLEETNALVRGGMVHLLSGPLGLYVINEFPKSGGTWVGQMLGRALRVPFPRNRLPAPRPSIMHGHYLNPFGMKSVVVPWRDGRDVMISWYHQCLFPHELHNEHQVKRARRDLPFRDYNDVCENLPAFIEWSFTRHRSRRYSWTDQHFSWADFVNRWYPRKGVTHVRYEALRRNTAVELQRIVLELSGRRLGPEEAVTIAEEFSFERQAGRRPGEEDKRSFLRKGMVGDWRNHFSQGSREIFDRYAGSELILLGYERDRSWVRHREGDEAAGSDEGSPSS